MLKAIQNFMRLEASGGILLAVAGGVALVLSNSPLAHQYDRLIETPVMLQIGGLVLAKSLLHWINDGLMAIFFFLVGLEIKREVLAGELSTRDKAALPAVAALGGMVVPAVVYVAITAPDPALLRGWAIPAATDIAFALGVLALLGPRIPSALKVFLLALAIIDDLGAIIVIALFYTTDLSMVSLGVAVGAIAVLAVLNARGVAALMPYVLVGVVLWAAVLKSGVHATLAGVVLAMAVPFRLPGRPGHSPLMEAEHALHPWVAYGILPAFAFANAGVSLQGVSLANLADPVPLGIATGLFVGKQAGVMLFGLGATRLGLVRLPAGVSLLQFYGVALLTGIGFTMSLFIGALAFDDPALAAEVRLGVLAGSVLSGLAGYGVLRLAAPSPKPAEIPAR